jgi:glyoxylase-like metal-dependent hydrolase (beta-lactamase superfamily II)
MVRIRHLNCGTLHAPPNPKASCHCLLLETNEGLALVDAGIGLADVRDPAGRVGQAIIDAAGFQFDENQTALRQIERLGFSASDVCSVVLTHGDPDHAGGLADFPGAIVHASEEERAAIERGSPRYVAAQLSHRPRWKTYAESTNRWFGFEARRLDLGLPIDAFLIPLFGHTLGHCGVAIRTVDRWQLHVGDAYYLRVELTTDDHPVSALAALRAENDAMRRSALAELRRLARDHAGEIELLGYHDFSEFPAD